MTWKLIARRKHCMIAGQGRNPVCVAQLNRAAGAQAHVVKLTQRLARRCRHRSSARTEGRRVCQGPSQQLQGGTCPQPGRGGTSARRPTLYLHQQADFAGNEAMNTYTHCIFALHISMSFAAGASSFDSTQKKHAATLDCQAYISMTPWQWRRVAHICIKPDA